MGVSLAFLIFSAGIAGLFFLDRDKSVHTSKALWLPVVFLWIVGSRPVSSWFITGGGTGSSLSATLDGSPIDAAVYGVLTVGAIAVVFSRRARTAPLLRASWPILLYFLYTLVSTSWSPFPFPAFKRWTKDIGDLAMGIIVVTDIDPLGALRRLYSRVGFILLPLSVLSIRYTGLGRGFDPQGEPMNTGLTTNKNDLGLIVCLISLGALWNLCVLLRDKRRRHRIRRLVAQGTLVVVGIALLQMAHCATAVACFALGSGLILATGLRAIRDRPARLHALCLGAILLGGVGLLFGGESVVTSALGRKSNLTDRTDIWKASLASADNPLFGSGFESFWNANGSKVAVRLSNYYKIQNLVSAHNGYIQIYLDLGLVGLSLIVVILIMGYWRAVKAFRRDRDLGSLMLTYIVTAAFYNITEAGFRTLDACWIFLLLAVVSASGIAAGVVVGRARTSPEIERRNSDQGLSSSAKGRRGWAYYARGSIASQS